MARKIWPAPSYWLYIKSLPKLMFLRPIPTIHLFKSSCSCQQNRPIPDYLSAVQPLPSCPVKPIPTTRSRPNDQPPTPSSVYSPTPTLAQNLPTSQHSDVPPPAEYCSDVPPPADYSSVVPPPADYCSDVPPPADCSNVPPSTDPIDDRTPLVLHPEPISTALSPELITAISLDSQTPITQWLQLLDTYTDRCIYTKPRQKYKTKRKAPKTKFKQFVAVMAKVTFDHNTESGVTFTSPLLNKVPISDIPETTKSKVVYVPRAPPLYPHPEEDEARKSGLTFKTPRKFVRYIKSIFKQQ